MNCARERICARYGRCSNHQRARRRISANAPGTRAFLYIKPAFRSRFARAPSLFTVIHVLLTKKVHKRENAHRTFLHSNRTPPTALKTPGEKNSSTDACCKKRCVQMRTHQAKKEHPSAKLCFAYVFTNSHTPLCETFCAFVAARTFLLIRLFILRV